MFKPIPGNAELLISLENEVKEIATQECAPELQNGDMISLFMYGKFRYVDRKWLALIAHFEVKLPENLTERIFSITFTAYKINNKCKTPSGSMMVFKSPIKLNDEFRIIPCFTNYAISNRGVVINVWSQKIIPQYKIKEYFKVLIYCPDTGRYRRVMVHRLVAMAWVQNYDYLRFTIINHKDGNAENNHHSNLEWVSYKENIQHALETGLRSDNIPHLLRDVKTGEVYEFCSRSEALRFAGCAISGSKGVYKKHSTLLNNRYEIKPKADNRPWFYEDKDRKIKLNKYIISVKFPDGSGENYYDRLSFQRKYSIWNISNTEGAIKKARQLYPELIFDIEDISPNVIFEIYNTITGDICEVKGISRISRKLNTHKNKIRNIIRLKRPRQFGHFIVREKSNEVWDLNVVEHPFKSRRILATNGTNGDFLEFSSLRKAAAYFETNRTVIKNAIKNGTKISNFTFREIV